jgi:protein-disulfide isomerase
MKRYLPFIIIVVVLVAVIGIFSITLRRGKGGADTGAVLVNSNQPAQTGGNPSAQNPPTPGQSTPSAADLTKPNVKVSSPVVLEEYGDYQCPPCGQLYPELKQVEHEYGAQLQIVFHHFPLIKIHKNALRAAQAAEAARNQNKFWEMHDRLYRNQKDWAEQEDPRPTFLSYARQLNLNVAQFTNDMESNLVDQRISADIKRGAVNGVTGTPTVFIEGAMLKYEATTPEGLRAGINAMLKRKATP